MDYWVDQWVNVRVGALAPASSLFLRQDPAWPHPGCQTALVPWIYVSDAERTPFDFFVRSKYLQYWQFLRVTRVTSHSPLPWVHLKLSL